MASRRERGGRAQLTSGPRRGPHRSSAQLSRCASSGSPAGHEPRREDNPKLQLVGCRNSSLASYWSASPPLSRVSARPRPPGFLAPSSKGTWKCSAGADVALRSGSGPGRGPGWRGGPAHPGFTNALVPVILMLLGR